MKLLIILLVLIIVMGLSSWPQNTTEPEILAFLKNGKSVTVGNIIITPHRDWEEDNPVFYVWDKEETFVAMNSAHLANKQMRQ